MARKTKAEALRTRQQIIEAARHVFHEHGVARSTLEQVACRAGLTRGAVYWHFKDKTQLFQAVREDVFNPMHERIEAILCGDRHPNPLDAIEAALQELFVVLDECPTVRQMLEIMMLRCEFAEEFAAMQQESESPGVEFLERLEEVYGKAAAKGLLRPGTGPTALALDTWVFVAGLLHVLITRGFEARFKSQVPRMIAAHMALRRP